MDLADCDILLLGGLEEDLLQGNTRRAISVTELQRIKMKCSNLNYMLVVFIC